MAADNLSRLHDRYPSIAYLAEAAKRRMPHFAWEYLDSGTGLEEAVARNRAAFDAVTLKPRFMKGRIEPDISVELFGKRYDAPLGVAPVGFSGMLWPEAETMLARMAATRNIAYCLSMVACETPETIGAAAGANAWFQLYPMADKDAEADLLNRARDSGMEVLVVTIDVPVNSTRERQRKAGLGKPGLSASRLAQIAARPAWARATARRGMPKFRMLENYLPDADVGRIMEFVASQRLGEIDLAHMKKLREQWSGALVVKGVMHETDAAACVELGADAIWVSNHGARQFDAAPAAIEVLPAICEAIGAKTPVLYDSGVRTGLDVARALALGADMVFAGRAFLYGPAAAGKDGADLVAEILIDDLRNNMIQAGAGDVEQLRAALA